MWVAVETQPSNISNMQTTGLQSMLFVFIGPDD
jgi:hypothetical protein